ERWIERSQKLTPNLSFDSLESSHDPSASCFHLAFWIASNPRECRRSATAELRQANQTLPRSLLPRMPQQRRAAGRVEHGIVQVADGRRRAWGGDRAGQSGQEPFRIAS